MAYTQPSNQFVNIGDTAQFISGSDEFIQYSEQLFCEVGEKFVNLGIDAGSIPLNSLHYDLIFGEKAPYSEEGYLENRKRTDPVNGGPDIAHNNSIHGDFGRTTGDNPHYLKADGICYYRPYYNDFYSRTDYPSNQLPRIAGGFRANFSAPAAITKNFLFGLYINRNPLSIFSADSLYAIILDYNGGIVLASAFIGGAGAVDQDITWEATFEHLGTGEWKFTTTVNGTSLNYTTTGFASNNYTPDYVEMYTGWMDNPSPTYSYSRLNNVYSTGLEGIENCGTSSSVQIFRWINYRNEGVTNGGSSTLNVPYDINLSGTSFTCLINRNVRTRPAYLYYNNIPASPLQTETLEMGSGFPVLKGSTEIEIIMSEEPVPITIEATESISSNITQEITTEKTDYDIARLTGNEGDGNDYWKFTVTPTNIFKYISIEDLVINTTEKYGYEPVRVDLSVTSEYRITVMEDQSE